METGGPSGQVPKWCDLNHIRFPASLRDFPSWHVIVIKRLRSVFSLLHPDFTKQVIASPNFKIFSNEGAL